MHKYELKGFKQFHELRKSGKEVKEMGIKGSLGDINRVAARVRLAKSYEKIELDDYSPATRDAYSALFRVFLTFSAFEAFLRLFGFKYFNADEILDNYDCVTVSQMIRETDKNFNFLDFLKRHADRGSLKESLEAFKSGSSNNPILVAAITRHSFAHGALSANPRGVSLKAMKKICNELVDFMIDVMDEVFSSRVEGYLGRVDEKR